MLALQKQGRKIKLSTGDGITVLLDKNKPSPDWDSMITKKTVATIDGKTINFSYVALVEAFELEDKKYDGLDAWINELPRGVKELAQHISEVYKEKRSTDKHIAKIPMSELKDKINRFYQKGKTKDYSVWYSIFLKNGGNENIIK